MIRTVRDESGAEWVATVREEVTPRHHGRWYMAFHPTGAEAPLCPVPEIRWQTADSGERTIAAMSDFELRRRLLAALARYGSGAPVERSLPA